MKQLFHGGHRFEFGETQNVDGKLCRSVRVVAGEDLFQFWIDESAGLIRRVDLPPIAAPNLAADPAGATDPPGIPPGLDARRQSMTLSLELRDASFDVPRHAPDIKPLPRQPKYVRQFVPLPPPEPSQDSGKQVHNQWREQVAAYEQVLRQNSVANK